MEATDIKPVWDRKKAWDGVGDPAQDKNQIIVTPSFAFDWEHQWMWSEAIEMLRWNTLSPDENKRFKVNIASIFDKIRNERDKCSPL